MFAINAVSGLNNRFLNLGGPIAAGLGTVITACYTSLLFQTTTATRTTTYSAGVNGGLIRSN